MRVGIFTFPNSISYGAVLQMYALYRTVKKLGHDAEVINYHNAYMKAEKHMGTGSKSGVKYSVKKTAKRILHGRLYGGFRAFEKKHLTCYPKKSFSSMDELGKIGKRYDAVICGSDQVWNPDITDMDMSYFLDFCGEGTRRISYAPSFGIDRFSPAFCDAIRGELEKFSALSVREEPGQALIRQLLNREVPVVVDPTLLVSSEEWSRLERKHPAGDGDYILYYTIRRSDSLLRYCKELSAKTGMKMVIVGGNALKTIRNRDSQVEYATDISPQEWLYLVHHARYVVTNSFHGTAFSINYRKDFYVELSSLTNSRLAQIVGMLELEARIVQKDQPPAVTDADYSAADKILPGLCEKSLQYLENALQ